MEQVGLLIPGMDNPALREAYKVLRTNLQFCVQDHRTIVFTSCGVGEGKTTVTLNLGKSLADQGKRVLVVDADMRSSVMSERIAGLGPVRGLSEVLTGKGHVSECIYHTDHSGMDVLFAGKYPSNPVELLGSKRFATLIGAGREHYDYVLVDTPPLGSVIDAVVVAAVCDGVILILTDGSVRYSKVREVINQLEKSGSRLLGVVRNRPGKRPGHRNR